MNSTTEDSIEGRITYRFDDALWRRGKEEETEVLNSAQELLLNSNLSSLQPDSQLVA